MDLLGQEKIESNAERYKNGLYYCLNQEHADSILEYFGENLFLAPNGRFVHTGGFFGGFIDAALTRINKISGLIKLLPNQNIDSKSLYKLSLLNGIAKVNMFEPTSESFKNKKGQYFENVSNFDDDSSITVNEKSLFILINELNIPFTEQEYNAFLAIDKKSEDNFFNTNPLFVLLNSAISLSKLEEKAFGMPYMPKK